MIGMTEKSKDLVSPVIKSEKSADTDIINASLLSPVECGKPVFKISFLPSQVIPFICFGIVCLLEYLVCPYT
jgi:hypothetical protein